MSSRSTVLRPVPVAIAIFAAILAAILALGGCRDGRSRGEYTLGVIATLSGESAANGRHMIEGVELAVQRVNENGGLRAGGRFFRAGFVVQDDRNSPNGAMSAARKLIFQEEVDALVGPQLSSHAIPVSGLAENERVPMICPMSTHPETTAGKEYVFRIPFLDTFQGAVLADFARVTLGAERAAVLYDVAGDYSRTLAEVFIRTFRDLGGTITNRETYTIDQGTDFTEPLERIAAASPDVLLLPNFNADVWRQGVQARRRGVEAVLLGGDGWGAERCAGLEQFDGSYLVRHWHAELETEASREFVRAYGKAYGGTPEDVAATTYDACGVLFEAVRAAGSVEPDPVRLALYSLETYHGVTGTIEYRGSGDPVKSAVILGIDDGRVEVHTIIDPEDLPDDVEAGAGS